MSKWVPDIGGGVGAAGGIVPLGVLAGIGALYGLVGLGVVLLLIPALLIIFLSDMRPWPRVVAVCVVLSLALAMLHGWKFVPVFLVIALVLFLAAVVLIWPFVRVRLHVVVRILGALVLLAGSLPVVQLAFCRTAYPAAGKDISLLLDCSKRGFKGDDAAACWTVRDRYFYHYGYRSSCDEERDELQWCTTASCRGTQWRIFKKCGRKGDDACNAAKAQIDSAKQVMEESLDSSRALAQLQSIQVKTVQPPPGWYESATSDFYRDMNSCLRNAKVHALIEEGAIYNQVRRQPVIAFQRYREAVALLCGSAKLCVYGDYDVLSVAYVEMGLIAYTSDEPELGDYERYFWLAKLLLKDSQTKEADALRKIMMGVYREAGRIAPVA